VPKRSLIEQLDTAVQALLARPAGAPAQRAADVDRSALGLLRIAEGLRSLPRADFKIRLKTDLQRRASMTSTGGSAARPEQSSQGEKLDAMMQEYRTISPYLIIPRASDFIAFLTRAFGAVERFRFPRPDTPNFIMHAEVGLGNGVLELADSNEQYRPAPQCIHLYVDDADSTYEAALEAGARSIYAPVDQPWGDRWGAVRDAFGNLWYIATPKTWTPGPEGIGSVQTYFHLKDADGMIPFLQNAFGGVLLGDLPRSPEGKLLHATVQIGNNTLEISEAHGEFQPMPCHMHLHVSDADSLYARALAAGAKSVDPPSDKPYGRSGGVRDAFGNTWYITSPPKPTRA
jgi:PhnB protein